MKFEIEQFIEMLESDLEAAKEIENDQLIIHLENYINDLSEILEGAE